MGIENNNNNKGLLTFLKLMRKVKTQYQTYFHSTCYYWKYTPPAKFYFFSKKAFLSYAIFCCWKTPLTYSVVRFWQLAKFTKFAKLQNTCLVLLWTRHCSIIISMLFYKSNISIECTAQECYFSSFSYLLKTLNWQTLWFFSEKSVSSIFTTIIWKVIKFRKFSQSDIVN